MRTPKTDLNTVGNMIAALSTFHEADPTGDTSMVCDKHLAIMAVNYLSDEGYPVSEDHVKWATTWRCDKGLPKITEQQCLHCHYDSELGIER